MDKISKHFLQGIHIDMGQAKHGDIYIIETLLDKQSIMQFENGLLVINIQKANLPLIHRHIDLHKDNIFSDISLEFMKNHFKLNSIDNPVEYIYGLTSAQQLTTHTLLESTIKIDLETLQGLQPNRFTKYPFRNPSDQLLYFGTYVNGEIASLVSGYLGQAVELTGETLPEYRNQGYAKYTTLAIAKYLLDNDYEVFTTNAVHNTASIRTVESLGFQKYGNRMIFYTA